MPAPDDLAALDPRGPDGGEPLPVDPDDARPGAPSADPPAPALRVFVRPANPEGLGTWRRWPGR